VIKEEKRVGETQHKERRRESEELQIDVTDVQKSSKEQSTLPFGALNCTIKSISGKSIPLAAISVQNNTPLERLWNFLYKRALFLGTILP
jgi:hypothetical protein